MELACDWISPVEIEKEIPFLCELITQGPPELIEVMYGMNCESDRAWQATKIPAVDLQEWIGNSIRRGIYSPGTCDIFISQAQHLKIQLCHESDIHVETTDAKIIEACSARWLEKGYRVHRRRLSAGRGWKDVWSVDDVLSALFSGD